MLPHVHLEVFYAFFLIAFNLVRKRAHVSVFLVPSYTAHVSVPFLFPPILHVNSVPCGINLNLLKFCRMFCVVNLYKWKITESQCDFASTTCWLLFFVLLAYSLLCCNSMPSVNFFFSFVPVRIEKKKFG